MGSTEMVGTAFAPRAGAYHHMKAYGHHHIHMVYGHHHIHAQAQGHMK